jgi:hypothetical protein
VFAGRRKKPLILRSRDQIFAIYLDHDDIFNLGTKGNFVHKNTLFKTVAECYSLLHTLIHVSF